MRVLVLSGGDSPERDVSLRSGSAILNALRELGISVDTYDPLQGFDGLIDAAKNVDVVFPILHGLHGEDGTIQTLLEENNCAYLGSNSAVSEICFDKIKTHQKLESAGIKMPRYRKVSKYSCTEELFTKPYVLKPITGGSSIDTLIVRKVENSSVKATKELLSKHEVMLVEELIQGTEITVGVLGAEALPPVYIVPPEGSEFDYENKYNGSSKEICPIPETLLSVSIQQKAGQIASEVHHLLGCEHLSRTDIMVDENNELYVLEINTMPGMTNQSLYPLSAKAHGLSMPQLVAKLLEYVNKERS